MKKLAIIAAALFCLASCQKNELAGPGPAAAPVFTASIDAGVAKTTIDASTGKLAWESDDEINVTDANGKTATYKITSIDPESGKATFEFKRGDSEFGTAPYTAVYGKEPATKQTYSESAGKLYMAAPETNDNDFVFTVQCGLMKLNLTKAGTAVRSIKVTGTIAEDTEVTYTLKCDPVQDIEEAKDFLIALPAGTYSKIEVTNSIDFKCTLNASSGVVIENNHIRPVTIAESKLSFATEHERVQLWAGGPFWATTNIGAESPEECGDYLSWGELESKEKYSWGYYKFGNERNITKYNDSDELTTLLPEDDAATVRWGGDWRMPTKRDFENLRGHCDIELISGDITGYLCTGRGDYSDKSIFLPAAGIVITFLRYFNIDCYYLTATRSDSPDKSRMAHIMNEFINFADQNRCDAAPVRPIMDVPMPGIPKDGIRSYFNVSDTRKVCFAKGNLTYDVEGKQWGFFDHQYDFAETYDSNLISQFTWGFNEEQSIIPDGVDDNNVSIDTGNLSQTQDWGSQIGDGNTWRTLSSDEWDYLISNNICYPAIVCGIYGYVLVPNGNIGDISVSYNKENWEIAEKEHGYVFLPYAGYRAGDGLYGSGEGYYWTSTAYNSGNAKYVLLGDSTCDPGYVMERSYGCSVRLVADCN